MMTLAGMLVLTVVTYYLAENGKINNFPTYLAGIAFITLILTRPSLCKDLDRTTLTIIGILLLYFAASALWSEGGNLLLMAKYVGYAMLLLAFVVGIPITAQAYPGAFRWLMAVFVLSATISACYSVYLYFALPDYQPLIEHRLFALGRLSNPVVGALSYGIAAVVCTNMVSACRGPVRNIYVACLAMLLFSLLLTETRSAWVGIIVAIPAVIILQRELSRGRRLRILAGFVALLTLIAAFTWQAGFWDEILHRATSYRPELWGKTLVDTWQANFISGYGIASNGKLTIGTITFHHAHSLYLTAYFHGGLIGLLLLAGLLVRCFWRLLQLADSPLRLLALSSLLYASIALVFDGDRILEKVDFIWIVFWFPVALCLTATLKNKAISMA